ncbi:MAG: type II toxin-antitoxin system VapC family toxin [Gemmataceae bacterium]|nr:type II toxin-antitoxin system VapC family toxin [Gemmataceae bacterium]
MSLYVLDTDILSLYQHDHPGVTQAIESRLPVERAITVISVEEQFSGWYTMLRQARKPQEVARIYLRLARNTQVLAKLQILSFTEPAIARYDALVAMRLNVGKYDLRIAAVALENGATLVTRNLRDFQRVPGLIVENWAS